MRLRYAWYADPQTGSSGSRGIEIVHGQCYSEESLSAGHKKGKKKGLGVGSVGCDDGRSYANIHANASAIASTTPFAASSLYFLRLAPVVLLARC